MPDTAYVDLARQIATRAHQGQTDKAGQPYINHPARVAARMAGDPAAEAVAWLHDVLEDTPVTETDLASAGIPAEVIDAVRAITHPKGEPNETYYARVRANPLALRVKVDGDIADNTDPERLARLDADTRHRLQAKYEKATEMLTA